eukprot:CCRYP_017600-RB/>CCRYP_017600-RB protein AED:0.46 eAED:0.46 QI:0/-1/0/1/-1/0/1/0/61
MLPTLMLAKPTAALEPTSCDLKITPSFHTMDPSSPSHKSSSLLRLLLPNPNWRPSLFVPKK